MAVQPKKTFGEKPKTQSTQMQTSGPSEAKGCEKKHADEDRDG